MTCNQARVMLAAYRELKKGDTLTLDTHLEQCAACRQAFSHYNLVGEQIRSLPTLAPSPDAHTQLLRVLSAEHSRLLQNVSTAASTKVPDFLKPYLQEQASRSTDTIAAFSTAKTGPLPLIGTRRRHRSPHRGQFAILGLAATFLMLLLVSGLVSLLLLANRSTSNLTTSIANPYQAALVQYTTTTDYPHMVSAVATRTYVYYSAYGDTSSKWMIEQMDSKTRVSIPLLTTASTSPLFMLGSSNDWLIWLQLDAPKSQTNIHLHQAKARIVQRAWSLHRLYIGTDMQQSSNLVEQPTLLKGVFDQSTAPSWVHTPVQGIWFTQQALLVAAIDKQGIAHLWQYQLDTGKASPLTQIATAKAGHILTSPTATSDGTALYWSEEWLSADTVLHSNIWMQQTTNVAPALHSQGHTHVATIKSLLRSDGQSFHPQVVDNTLYLLSTSVVTDTQSTPVATTIPTATQTPTNVFEPSVTARIDPAFYITQVDAGVRGTLLAFSLDHPLASPVPLVSNGLASALQVGTHFLLWQSDSGYQMYDVAVAQSVNVGSVPTDATFLTVNGDTTIWTVGGDSTATTVAFRLFYWPTKAPQQ